MYCPYLECMIKGGPNPCQQRYIFFITNNMIYPIPTKTKKNMKNQKI